MASLSTDTLPKDGGHPKNMTEFQAWRQHRPRSFPSNPNKKWFDAWYSDKPWETFCGEGKSEEDGGIVSIRGMVPAAAPESSALAPLAAAAVAAPFVPAARAKPHTTAYLEDTAKVDPFFSDGQLVDQSQFMEGYNRQRGGETAPDPAQTRSATVALPAASSSSSSAAPPPQSPCSAEMENGTRVSADLTPGGSMHFRIIVPPEVVAEQGLDSAAATSPIFAAKVSLLTSDPSLLNIALACGLSGAELDPYHKYDDDTFGLRKPDAAGLGDRIARTASSLIAPLLTVASFLRRPHARSSSTPAPHAPCLVLVLMLVSRPSLPPQLLKSIRFGADRVSDPLGVLKLAVRNRTFASFVFNETELVSALQADNTDALLPVLAEAWRERKADKDREGADMLLALAAGIRRGDAGPYKFTIPELRLHFSSPPRPFEESEEVLVQYRDAKSRWRNTSRTKHLGKEVSTSGTVISVGDGGDIVVELADGPRECAAEEPVFSPDGTLPNPSFVRFIIIIQSVV